MPVVRKNPLRASLSKNKICLGSFQLLSDPASSEITLGCGFEFMLIDAEHRAFDPHRVEALIATIQGVGKDKSAVVRVPEISRGTMQYALDSGADGVLIPLVNTQAEAERAVSYCRYPPKGTRGLNSAARAAGWWQPNAAVYARATNKSVVAMVQIETVSGLENVDQIASVPGVDMLFVGPMDLSHGMGLTGQFGHPEVRAAIAKIFKTGLQHNKWLGVLAPDAEFAQWCVSLGARFIVCRSDARFLREAGERAWVDYQGLDKKKTARGTAGGLSAY